MSTHSTLAKVKNDIHQPYLARIIKVLPQIQDHLLFQIKFEDPKTTSNFNYRPGQFVELSVIGSGEAPISLATPLEQIYT
ncbi:unnamed protein product [marine sediment metagenome]|uniref:FAD-binding FR-type domain-containing protein n=1 Tax=marine sediment metagenome TaxID=412755 RepID=X1IAU6_9ZZZZ